MGVSEEPPEHGRCAGCMAVGDPNNDIDVGAPDTHLASGDPYSLMVLVVASQPLLHGQVGGVRCHIGRALSGHELI